MRQIPPDDVQAEAAAWLVRLRSDSRQPADDLAFQAWIAADASHAAAFEAMSSTWDITGGLPHDLRGMGHALPAGNRRRVLAGAAVLLAAGGGAALWRNAGAGIYQTEVGEQKHISLEDGTRIFLDTDTKLRMRFSDTMRSAELHYGQANFRVTSDAARPFVINAARSRIIADSANLDLRCDGERVCVVMVRGAAQVLRPNTQPERLQDGDRFVMDGDKDSRRDRPSLVPLLAWQNGQAIFENGRLTEAVAEMNRYSLVKLAVADTRVGDLRVSGIYAVGDNVAFANSVSRLLPVRIVQGESRIIIMPDDARPAHG